MHTLVRRVSSPITTDGQDEQDEQRTQHPDDHRETHGARTKRYRHCLINAMRAARAYTPPMTPPSPAAGGSSLAPHLNRP